MSTARKPSAKDRTLNMFGPPRSDDVRERNPNEFAEHFPERVVKVGRVLFSEDKAHLIGVDEWEANYERGILKTLCGVTRDQQMTCPFELVGLNRRVCQACLAKAAKARVVQWRGRKRV